MYYTMSTQGRPKYVGIAVVVLLHLGLIWAAIHMIRSHGEARQTDVLTTEIIQDVPPPPEEEPPPPPPEVDIELAPMPDMVVLPEIVFDTPPPPAAIQQVAHVDTVPDVQPPAPAPTPAPEPKPPGVVKQPGLPKRLVKPDYPRRSRQLNEEGTTTMRVCINENGRVSEANVTQSSGSQRLDDAALTWVRGLRGFQPKTIDGKAVDGGCMLLPLEWEITDR